MDRILSLDIAASVTGWAFTLSEPFSQFKFGTIETSAKLSRAQRLVKYRKDLSVILKELKPTRVVIEDVFSGLNPTILILLSKFAGVTEESCLSILGIEPFIIHTNTVKAYFKTRTKADLFDFVVDLFEFDKTKFTFKKCNDMGDALAQLICYCHTIIECREFRIEKEYGYLYEV